LGGRFGLAGIAGCEQDAMAGARQLADGFEPEPAVCTGDERGSLRHPAA